MHTEAQLLKAALFAALLFFGMATDAESQDHSLNLTLRSRSKGSAEPGFLRSEMKISWDPKKTAIIICDMWDDHWCKSQRDAWRNWPAQ